MYSIIVLFIIRMAIHPVLFSYFAFNSFCKKKLFVLFWSVHWWTEGKLYFSRLIFGYDFWKLGLKKKYLNSSELFLIHIVFSELWSSNFLYQSCHWCDEKKVIWISLKIIIKIVAIIYFITIFKENINQIKI